MDRRLFMRSLLGLSGAAAVTAAMGAKAEAAALFDPDLPAEGAAEAQVGGRPEPTGRGPRRGMWRTDEPMHRRWRRRPRVRRCYWTRNRWGRRVRRCVWVRR